MKILNDLMKARMFGHPIHLMINHFPAALLPGAVLFDAAGYFLQNRILASAAFFALGLGVAGGLLALITGAIDLFNINSERISEFKLAALHGGLNTLWLCIFGVIFGIRIKEYPDIQVISTVSLVVLVLSAAGLLFANYLGGELLLKYGIGLKDESINKIRKNQMM